jgi:hypothetical protein
MRSIVLLVLLATSTLAGCYATAAGMKAKRAEPDAGTAREYAGPCDRHFAKAKDTLERMKLDVLAADSAEGEILARRSSMSLAGDGGDRVAVWLDGTRSGKACRIRVYSRGQNEFGIGGTGWQKQFFTTYKPPFIEDPGAP